MHCIQGLFLQRHWSEVKLSGRTNYDNAFTVREKFLKNQNQTQGDLIIIIIIINIIINIIIIIISIIITLLL